MDQKQLTDLTAKDFLERQVWEHWTIKDTEYVSPSDQNQIIENDNIGHIVLTDFTLNTGVKMIGFCSPQDTSGLDYTQPTILTEKGQFKLFKDNDWTNDEKTKELKKIDLDWKEVFPIKFITRIKCNGDFYRGTVTDFNRDE